MKKTISMKASKLWKARDAYWKLKNKLSGKQ
jgi:hypothetical protein